MQLLVNTSQDRFHYEVWFAIFYMVVVDSPWWRCSAGSRRAEGRRRAGWSAVSAWTRPSSEGGSPSPGSHGPAGCSAETCPPVNHSSETMSTGYGQTTLFNRSWTELIYYLLVIPKSPIINGDNFSVFHVLLNNFTKVQHTWIYVLWLLFLYYFLSYVTCDI